MKFKLPPYEWQHKAMEMSTHLTDMALLADMGTGKTGAMVNILRMRYNNGRRVQKTLILSPLVTLLNWREEFFKHSYIDTEKVVVLMGSTKKKVKTLTQATLNDPNKIVIMNYRIRSLPRAVYKYIKKTYWRLHGNVYIYSPIIKSGESRPLIRFDGTYQAINFKGGSRTVKIDGKEIKQGDLLFLEAGKHTVDSTVKLRLRLDPKGWRNVADPLYERQSAIFDMPYRY